MRSMKRFKVFLLAVLASFAIGTTSASTASAGTVTGSVFGCTFTADYTGGPPPALATAVGSSAVIAPPPSTCDPSLFNSISDVQMSFQHLNSPNNWQATLGIFTVNVHVPLIGDCDFTTTSPIATDLPGPTNVLGPYSATGTMVPTSGGGCSVVGPTPVAWLNVTFI